MPREGINVAVRIKPSVTAEEKRHESIVHVEGPKDVLVDDKVKPSFVSFLSKPPRLRL